MCGGENYMHSLICIKCLLKCPIERKHPIHFVVVIQLLSHVQLFAIPWTAACQVSLSFTISRSLLKLISLSWWCHPTILSSVIHFSCFQSFPGSIFSNELALHIRQPKYWSSNFSISLSNEYSGLIFFRTGWFDLCAVQGTLKSLLQYHS